VLLVCYDYFRPAYQAGGIVQSLDLLVQMMHPYVHVVVLTGKNDLGGVLLKREQYLEGVEYLEPIEVPRRLVYFLKNDVSCVYLNGLFSFTFFLIPLITTRWLRPSVKVIVAPRGMLQKGALQLKKIKKKFYLEFLLRSGLLKNVHWHATDIQETLDIKAFVGPSAQVTLAGNLPKTPYLAISIPNKETEVLKLVFLGIITPSKNLKRVLEAMAKGSRGIFLSIVGPVGDSGYWSECQAFIEQASLQHAIEYRGPVAPHKIQELLTENHGLILPSIGENFGHAIYEAFSVGRPVIIGHNTPWKELRARKMGWNVDTHALAIQNAMDEFLAMDQNEYRVYCTNAHQEAVQYFERVNQSEPYRTMFGV